MDELTNSSDRKKTYKQLAMKYHPDKGGSDELFNFLNTYYNETILSKKKDIEESNIASDRWDSYYNKWYRKEPSYTYDTYVSGSKVFEVIYKLGWYNRIKRRIFGDSYFFGNITIFKIKVGSILTDNSLVDGRNMEKLSVSSSELKILYDKKKGQYLLYITNIKFLARTDSYRTDFLTYISYTNYKVTDEYDMLMKKKLRKVR